ncbi:uncharacterized protein JCM6883_003840 [Sporobolomyces salmoneus]|uniref:uncharacterized protein n=1 Tax=Sporobolomyces salmoneus TaxID=183962 RepID=UPI00316FE3FF
MSSSFQPSHQHSGSHSSASSLLPANTPSPYANSANQTRILLLSDFDPSLKTRDLMELLSEWEDDRGGFKVKWRDDTSAFIVFHEATTAKRAFLSLLTSPSPSLLSATSSKLHPNISAYTGSDVQQILQAVQNRPRSHSNAGMSHHSRRGSLAGSGSGSGLMGNSSNGPVTTNSAGGGGGGGASHHSRTASWGRNSLDRRAAKDLIDSSTSGSSMTASGLPSNPFSSSSGAADGRASPEAFSQGHGGIVAGDTPRRIGMANGVHRRSGSESAGGSRVAGSTIRE